MDYRNLLNERQYDAVSTDAKYARVVAGAGSGKTRVLTYRISYLISEKNVDPFSIVAIAFTNKVADEMRSRALSLLGGNCAGLSVSTFHSYCAKFLRKEIDILGYPNNFTIMDDDDQETLVKDIAVENGYKRNDDIVKFTLSYIAFNKCNGIYPEDIRLDSGFTVKEKEALKFFHLYEQRKEQMLSLDFDDLLLKTIKILEEYDMVREKWQKRISNILIDEFQDTNNIQYKLVKLLMNEDTALYVVGDPDQTIYTWRGANQEIILNFTKDFPLAETIILNRNYRSTKTILDSANKLIAHNKKRVPKDLYTEEAIGTPIVVESCFSRDYEARYVADKVEELVRSKQYSYSDIAILYRAAYLTLPLEKEFMSRRIAYRIYGGLKFFQRKEIKDALAYFRLIYNPKDDLSFERIVNVPRRGIGDASIDALKAERIAANKSYIEYVKSIDEYSTEVKPKVIMAIQFMINQIDKTKARLNENLEAYPKILSDFLTELGYFDYLASDDEGQDRLSNVQTLMDDIVDFLRRYPESSFEEYLQNATLQTSQDEIKDGNVVSLMTIHVAKGLEFPVVFVISMIEGVFPSQKTMDESGHNGEEEERRLCYVAFTRAKEKLFVTYNTSYSFVLESKAFESRFIKEAGLSVPRKNDYYQYHRDNSFYRKSPIDRQIEYDFNQGRFNDSGYEKDEAIETPKITDNGIKDWKVGDIAVHDVFGRGIVRKVIDQTIIEVEFESCGRKSIMSTHPKIHRELKGAEA